jgi:hypothetical protein
MCVRILLPSFDAGLLLLLRKRVFLHNAPLFMCSHIKGDALYQNVSFSHSNYFDMNTEGRVYPTISTGMQTDGALQYVSQATQTDGVLQYVSQATQTDGVLQYVSQATQTDGVLQNASQATQTMHQEGPSDTQVMNIVQDDIIFSDEKIFEVDISGIVHWIPYN